MKLIFLIPLLLTGCAVDRPEFRETHYEWRTPEGDKVDFPVSKPTTPDTTSPQKRVPPPNI